jgi:hypothetical protein
MIATCSDCGFIGVSKGLNSGGWAFIIEVKRDKRGKPVEELHRSICPRCVDKCAKRATAVKDEATRQRNWHKQ